MMAVSKIRKLLIGAQKLFLSAQISLRTRIDVALDSTQARIIFKDLEFLRGFFCTSHKRHLFFAYFDKFIVLLFAIYFNTFIRSALHPALRFLPNSFIRMIDGKSLAL